jgi:hypothetical protein
MGAARKLPMVSDGFVGIMWRGECSAGVPPALESDTNIKSSLKIGMTGEWRST